MQNVTLLGLCAVVRHNYQIIEWSVLRVSSKCM